MQKDKIIQHKNFIVRVKAAIDKRMTDAGVFDMMLEGANEHKIYSKIKQAFFDSLDDIDINNLTGNNAKR